MVNGIHYFIHGHRDVRHNVTVIVTWSTHLASIMNQSELLNLESV